MLRKKIGWLALGLAITTGWSQPSDPYRISSTSKVLPGQSLKLISAEAHFPYEPDKVWALLNKFDEFPKYMPRVGSCESLGVLREKEQIYFLVNMPFPFPDLWNVVSVTRQPEIRQFAWEMLKGNMKSHEGTLTIDPEEKGSKIKLEVKTDPGHLLPQSVVAWGAKKYIPKLLRAVAAKLEKSK